MILQNLANMGPIDIIIIICHITVICFFFVPGVILLNKLKGKSKEIRNYLMGIALFFLLYGIARLVMFLFELTFDPFVWQIEIDEFDALFDKNPELNLRHDIVWRLSTGIGTLGLAFLMYQMETRILEKKTKYIFTIITIVTVIPALVLGVAGKDDITWVRIVLYVGNFVVIVIPLFYLYFAFKTTGDTRKRSIGAAIGMVILFFGIIWNSSIGKSLFYDTWGLPGLYATYYLYVIFIIIGQIFYLKSINL